MAGRKPTVSDSEILRIFQDSPDPALTTSEVAAVLGFSSPGASKRLHALADDGKLATKQPGQDRIWWLTDAGEEYLAAAE